MAYPFGKMPTLSEFVKQVSDKYGVQEKVPSARTKGPRGEDSPRYLSREVEGKMIIAISPNFSAQQPLPPSTIRTLCDALQIPSDEFGFSLSDITEDLNEDDSFATYPKE